MSALMTATNIAYAEAEKRGFFKQILVSLAFTFAAIVGFCLRGDSRVSGCLWP